MTVRTEVWRAVQAARRRAALRIWSSYGNVLLRSHPSVQVAGVVALSGPCDFDVDPRGKLLLGRGVRINSGGLINAVGGFRRACLRVHPSATLEIGDDVGISSSSIVCCKRIVIGARTFIGGDCAIYDSDFHSLDFEQRQLRPDPGVRKAEINIGEDCFIGAHSIILRGVQIGARAIVGAGSVVRCDIPEGELWAGNPAIRVAPAKA